MKELALPNYNELSLALDQTKLMLHPSETHGLISGILCSNLETDSTWKSAVTGDKESTEMHELLQQLFNASEKKLKDFLFDFQLILPADSQLLPVRAEALTLWCQGFLTGLEIAKAKMTKQKSNESAEALNDILEVAKMNYEEVVENEEDEEAYMELVEYVRMAVIFLYQELQDDSAKTSKMNKNIH